MSIWWFYLILNTRRFLIWRPVHSLHIKSWRIWGSHIPWEGDDPGRLAQWVDILCQMRSQDLIQSISACSFLNERDEKLSDPWIQVIKEITATDYDWMRKSMSHCPLDLQASQRSRFCHRRVLLDDWISIIFHSISISVKDPLVCLSPLWNGISLWSIQPLNFDRVPKYQVRDHTIAQKYDMC